MAKYTQVIPEWLDESVKAEDTSKMVKFLDKAGFSSEEIGSIYDSRIMSIVRKATLFDEIASTNLEEKRVTTAPKSMSATNTAPSKEDSRLQKVRDRAKKSGKVKDVAELIREMAGG